jgi:high-affinity nickel-transport protein
MKLLKALAAARASMDAAERRRIVWMLSAIAGLHLVGFVLLLAVVAPESYSLGREGAFTIGVGVTAYTLGIRHAFDADHIAAIDNTTRKLMADGQRPVGVGFFFALGHSTVVFLLAFLFSLGIRAVAGEVADDASTLHTVTGVVGASVSGTFLYVIAAINLAVLVGILRVFREMRCGRYDERQLEEQLDSRGFMNRILGSRTRSITRSWQMYPLGLLFGLGFDTATEVALLFIAAGAAGAGLPFHAILCLPILFAAGMSLFDTLDGSFMRYAYGWAFARPVRKIYYNITVTGLSVLVALVIGTIELLGVLADRLGLSGGFWDWVLGVDLNAIGYVIVGLFVATWIVALAVWRFAGIEERWSAGLAARIETP